MKAANLSASEKAHFKIKSTDSINSVTSEKQSYNDWYPVVGNFYKVMVIR